MVNPLVFVITINFAETEGQSYELSIVVPLLAKKLIKSFFKKRGISGQRVPRNIKI